MLARNAGGIDHILRIIVGLALIPGFFLNSEASLRWLHTTVIVPLGAGLFQSSPLNSLLGISPCPPRRDELHEGNSALFETQAELLPDCSKNGLAAPRMLG